MKTLIFLLMISSSCFASADIRERVVCFINESLNPADSSSDDDDDSNSSRASNSDETDVESDGEPVSMSDIDSTSSEEEPATPPPTPRVHHKIVRSKAYWDLNEVREPFEPITLPGPIPAPPNPEEPRYPLVTCVII